MLALSAPGALAAASRCESPRESHDNAAAWRARSNFAEPPTTRNALAAWTQFAGGLGLKPDFVEARYNHGLALAALDRAEEAIAEFERALAIAPEHGRAHAGLGRAFAALSTLRGSRRAAWSARSLSARPPRNCTTISAPIFPPWHETRRRRAFRRACERAPDFAIAHNNLGNALVALGKHQEAVASYRAAFAINPTFAEAYANMGSALADLHHPGDALPYFERALALNPHFAEAHNNRGQAFVALGHLPDARDRFVRAIALKPDRAEFYNGLAGCTRLARDDPHFLAMEALAEKLPSFDETEQTQLHFALAKAYEDQGRFEQAFAHFSAGNASRRRRMDYDEAAALAQMHRFAPPFGAGDDAARAAAGRHRRMFRSSLSACRGPARRWLNRFSPATPASSAAAS